MKRLLSILGSFMVTTTGTTTVVACVRKNSNKNPDTPAQSELVAIDEAFTNKDFGYPSVAINTTNSTNATIVQSGLLYGLYAANPKLKTVVAEYNAKITWERGVTLTKSGDGTMISVTFAIDTTRGPETKTYDRVVVRYGATTGNKLDHDFLTSIQDKLQPKLTAFEIINDLNGNLKVSENQALIKGFIQSSYQLTTLDFEALQIKTADLDNSLNWLPLGSAIGFQLESGNALIDQFPGTTDPISYQFIYNLSEIVARLITTTTISLKEVDLPSNQITNSVVYNLLKTAISTANPDFTSNYFTDARLQFTFDDTNNLSLLNNPTNVNLDIKWTNPPDGVAMPTTNVTLKISVASIAPTVTVVSNEPGLTSQTVTYNDYTFVHSTKKIIYFNNKSTTTSALAVPLVLRSDEIITGFMIDSTNNVMWIGTNQSLWHSTINKASDGSITSFTLKKWLGTAAVSVPVVDIPNINNFNVKTLVLLKNNTLMVANDINSGNGLYQFSVVSSKVELQHKYDNATDNLPKDRLLDVQQMERIGDNVYVATKQNKLFRYDNSNFTQINIGPQNYVETIYTVSNDNVLVISNYQLYMVAPSWTNGVLVTGLPSDLTKVNTHIWTLQNNVYMEIKNNVSSHNVLYHVTLGATPAAALAGTGGGGSLPDKTNYDLTKVNIGSNNNLMLVYKNTSVDPVTTEIFELSTSSNTAIDLTSFLTNLQKLGDFYEFTYINFSPKAGLNLAFYLFIKENTVKKELIIDRYSDTFSEMLPITVSLPAARNSTWIKNNNYLLVRSQMIYLINSQTGILHFDMYPR